MTIRKPIWAPVGWAILIGVLLWPLGGGRLAAGAALVALLAVGLGRAPWERVGAIAGPVWARGVALARGRSHALAGLGLAVLLAAPLALNNYVLDVLTLAWLYVVLALGLQITVGFAGLLDLGYAAFYAVGAYAYAIASTHWGLPVWAGLPLGAGLAAAFGVVLGVVTLRLRGDYLAIVTLGFIQIVHLVLINWDEVTNGPNGILHVGRPQIGDLTLTTPTHFYYLLLGLALVAILVNARVQSSRIGRAWMAIRDDEVAAEAMGVPTTRLKILAFASGAAWAGVAGVCFAGRYGFVSPESFTFFESVVILAMVVLGGLSRIPGVVIGAVVITVIPELLRGMDSYRMLLFGAALVAMMAWRPEGLLRRSGRRAPGEAAA
ncbi:MAG: branched-chain amino acid ABC transporter permease [Nitrospiria bacterium]